MIHLTPPHPDNRPAKRFFYALALVVLIQLIGGLST